MTNPTSNFGWQMPTSTDLVTDLPADFEVFGQAVDTSMADLKGGTTGQILSKATNADMDFTWITNDVGDITAVNVTSPITGGGSSGAVTIGVSAASTSASGVVQLSDSTSTTSSVLASTPTATKSAYDLANAAIAKSTVTTAGDIIYRNATVPTRLGIGTASQVLAVNSGATAPEWVTPSSGGITLISSTTMTGTTFTLSSIPQTYTNLYLVATGYYCTFQYENITMRFNADSGTNYDWAYNGSYATTTDVSNQNQQTEMAFGNNAILTGAYQKGSAFFQILNYAQSTVPVVVQGAMRVVYSNAGDKKSANITGQYRGSAGITSISLISPNTGFAGGTLKLYGVK
jgi:hypothetical protein